MTDGLSESGYLGQRVPVILPLIFIHIWFTASVLPFVFVDFPVSSELMQSKHRRKYERRKEGRIKERRKEKEKKEGKRK
jgi:hypothetical protein